MNWYPLSCSGELPPPVYKHSCTPIRQKFWVIGGIHNGTAKLAAPNLHVVHNFDTETLAWSTIKTSGPPPPGRAAHAACAVGDRIFVIGGGDEAKLFLDDVAVLDTATHSWASVATTGALPGARRAHSAAVVGKRIVLFGGATPGGKVTNDCFALDTDTLVWSRIDASSPLAPSPRGYAAAWSIQDRLLLMGGTDGVECFSNMFILDCTKFTWQRCKVINSFPRYGHSATQVGSWLFAIGGNDGANSNECRVLHIDTKIFQHKLALGKPPSPRCFHTAIFHDSRLWVFGGDCGEDANLMQVLDLGEYAWLAESGRVMF